MNLEENISRWSEQPLYDLIEDATKSGLSYKKCSVNNVLCAAIVCVIPKNDKSRQLAQKFVDKTIGNPQIRPISDLQGLKVENLIDSDAMNAIVVRVYESPYTVLVASANPEMAQWIEKNLIPIDGDGLITYFI